MKFFRVARRIASNAVTLDDFKNLLEDESSPHVRTIRRQGLVGFTNPSVVMIEFKNLFYLHHEGEEREIPVKVSLEVNDKNGFSGINKKTEGRVHITIPFGYLSKTQGVLSPHIFQMLIHELTHVYNSPYMKAEVGYMNRDETIDFDKYYRDPDEQSAYLSEFDHLFNIYMHEHGKDASVEDFLDSEPNVLQVVTHLPRTEACWDKVMKLLDHKLAAYKLDPKAPEPRSTDPSVENPVPINQGDVWAYMKDHIGPVVNALRSLYHQAEEVLNYIPSL